MSNRKQIYLFVGDDDHPLNEAARKLVNTLVPPANQAFGLEVIEGRADSMDDALLVIQRCHEALVTPGFLMAGSKTIWWRGVSFLESGADDDEEDGEPAGKGKGAKAGDRIKEALKALTAAIQAGQAADSVLVVSASKLDKRSAFYKFFVSHGEVKEFFLPERAGDIEKVGRSKIQATFRERGIAMEPDAVELFLSRIGADSRLIASEAEKLDLFLGERRRATVQDVLAVVSTTMTSVMWDLQDAVGDRKLSEALGILRDLLAGREEPIGIVTSLSSRIRELVIFREALDRGWLRFGSGRSASWGHMPDEVVDAMTAALKRPPESMHPFVVMRRAEQARNYTLAALRRSQTLLMEARETLVSSGVPPETVVELMLIRMMK